MKAKKFKTGIVIGKFYPPHLGHSHLIQSAIEQVKQLTVIVCDSPAYALPAKLRAHWLTETFTQKIKVIIVKDLNDDSNSKRWAKYTLKFLGYKPDVVFTSEEYGKMYAKYLGCRHICVDQARRTVPISGTKIRQDPLGAWEYLEPSVRAYFAKRVCILGAESSGTTTLAKALARHYKTTWVPEFGRSFYEARMHSRFIEPWSTEDFEYIAQQQNKNEDYFARSSNKLLICDTDSLTTSLWQKAFMGSVSESVLAHSRDRTHALYLLTDIDIPYVDDGTRGGKKRRARMHLDFQKLLRKHKKRFVLISGNRKQRLQKAVELCDQLINKAEPIK